MVAFGRGGGCECRTDTNISFCVGVRDTHMQIPTCTLALQPGCADMILNEPCILRNRVEGVELRVH